MATPAKKPEYTCKGKGKLLLTKGIQDQIKFLHKEVGPIEWCGVLFFKQVEGDISEPDTLVLQAEHIFPMDIGNAAYTESDLDTESIIKMHEMVDNDYSYKKGLIHTH